MKTIKATMKHVLIISPALALLAGCGAGAGGGLLGDGTRTATFYAGVYRNLGETCSGTQALMDRSNNIYAVCGTQLWVGKASGTLDAGGIGGKGSIKFTIYDSGAITPASTMAFPNGSVFTIPATTRTPSVSTTDELAGTFFQSSEGIVNWLQFADAKNNVLFSGKYVDAFGSITKSYSTLAGQYGGRIPGAIGASSYDTSTSITILANGTVSGRIAEGSMSGNITNFDGGSGVHDVSLTLTKPSGEKVSLIGVIGPYSAGLTGSTSDPYNLVVVALYGGGRKYVEFLTK